MISGSIQAVIRPDRKALASLSPMRAAESVQIKCASYEASNDGDGTAVVMYSDDEVWQVRFQFKSTALEDNKEYKLEDLIDYQSFIREDGTWNFYSYTDVSYKQWTEADGSFHVRAIVTTSNGKEWNISYDKGSTQGSAGECVLTFENKDVSLTDYIELDETFQFIGKNDNAEIRITISSDQIEGEYGWDQFIPLYSGIYLFGADGDTTLVSFTDITAIVKPIEGKHNAYTCDFSGVGNDGVVYKTLLSYIPEDIEAKEEVDIVADNLQVLDFIKKEHLVIFNGSNDKYGVSITVNTDELCGSWDITSIDGFWSDVSIYGDDGIPVEQYMIKNASIKFEKLDNGNEILSGWVLGSNKVKYNLNIYHKRPQATSQESIVSDNARIKDGTGNAEDPTVRIQGTSNDGKYFFSLALDTDVVTGTFKLDDFDKDYTYVDLLKEDGFTEKSYSLVDGEIQINVENGVYTATGKILMQNGDDTPEFTLDITALPQEGMDYDVETEGITANMSYIQTQEYNDEYGHYVLLVAATNATSPENMLYLQFMIDKVDADIVVPAGEYVINSSHTTSTVVACEGVSNGSVLPSFVCNLTPEGQALLPMWFLRTGKVTVSKNTAGGIHVEVDARNSYGQPVLVVADRDISAGIETIKTSSAKASKRIENGEIIIERNGKKYTVSGIEKQD